MRLIVVFLLGLLICEILAEEQSILTKGSVVQNDIHDNYTWNESALIDGNFKSVTHSGVNDLHGDGKKEFVIDLQTPQEITTIFMMNRADCGLCNLRFGTSAIWAGADATAHSSSFARCSNDFFDTGFQTMVSPCIG